MHTRNSSTALGKRKAADSVDEERKGSRAEDIGVSALLGGAAAGAVAGTFAGPVGAAVGAVAGAVAAGMAGNEISKSVDKTIEEAHWRENFPTRSYVEQGATFDDYGPAYVYGIDGFIQYQGRPFEEVESDLLKNWLASRGASTLDWERARPASRDAWNRLQESTAYPSDPKRS